MNSEFEVHKLNPKGVEKAQHLAQAFDNLLEFVKTVVPEGRELSLVKTKLEEASFFAKKGVAKNPSNQET